MKLTGLSARFGRRGVVLAAFAALLALAAAGVSAAAVMQKSGAAGASHSTATVIVNTRKISGYGTALVNAKGHTLYVFMKDNRQKVTCTGTCSSFWPALKQQGMTKATAKGAAKASLIGSDKNPSGGRSVTYAKWPLYTYVGDTAAGTTKGEGRTLNGGKWYMISPAGMLIKKKTSSTGGTTTTGGGWG
jgi:predicted lipoprotein with Yx(FWY)xxD motif